ncbi:hypothetical protein FOMPIDRAFT_1051905 [Fomitopsis schrenkii]|uniref:Uncharacterized protein n=1 Tax=Fomitopsis schrenkii TaxID=2126942 RepID=S8E3K7_FOMSC|nr:hypothetical protein FOMPIDRAFT_1051905 [Fomitopsis schrenkii]
MDWAFMGMSDSESSNGNPSLTAHLQPHFDYLLTLKTAWRNNLVVPGVWMSPPDIPGEGSETLSASCYSATPSREFSRGIIRLQLDLISDELSYLTNNELVDRATQDVVPHFTLSAERHVNADILFSEWEHAPRSNKVKQPTHMSLHQVAQILQYQDSEVLAEHTISTTLES